MLSVFPTQLVRLLIADVDQSAQILTDSQVQGYLVLNGADADAASAPEWVVRRAAADALDAIATSEAMVSKVIRTQDVSTDGAKVADSLRKQAVSLRAQADKLQADHLAAQDSEEGIGVVEFEPYPRYR